MAEAAECARDQGKFWELQSKFYNVFDGSAPITPKQVVQVAKQAGVKDMGEFKTCWENRKYKEKVANDIRDGVRLGIQGTPTFILGTYDPEADTVTGEMFSGAVPEAKFVRAIEKYLSLSRSEAKLIQ